MDIRRLFNRQRDPAGAVGRAQAQPGPGQPGQPAPVGSFITQETFNSFSGVTAFISTTYGVVVLIAPSAANYKGAVLAVICIVIGAAIYALNITDPQNPATPRQRVMGAGFALANSIQLFAATYGVTGLVAQAAAK